VRHHKITAVLSSAVLAVTLVGCSRLPDDPGPGPEDFAEEEIPEPSPVSLSPTPPQEGVGVSGCPGSSDVLAALIGAGTVESAAGLATDGAPTCAGDWSAAIVTATDADPIHVVLQTRGGRLYVVVAGSAVCGDPDISTAPAAILTAAGC
jgi:hypothetical protein